MMKTRKLILGLLILSLLMTACNSGASGGKDNDTKGTEASVTPSGNTDSGDTAENKDSGTDTTTAGNVDNTQAQSGSGSQTQDNVVLPASNTNPMIWADVPDMDIIRVEDYYYMVSTTMHMSPGAPIMRSKDLLNWETVSYAYDKLAEDNKHNLINDNLYGKGQWASSIRYNNGTFYVCFAALETGKTYIFRTTDVEKEAWERTEIPGYCHDPALFFDDDGKAYIIYGVGKMQIRELNEDLTGFKQGGVNQMLLDTAVEGKTRGPEGSHMYKINGMYYIFVIDWPNFDTNRRREWCFRSSSLLGPYEQKLVFDDNYGYGNSGVAQGGIVDTPDGSWYSFLFQDHGAVGRIPMLLPMTWVDGWPVIGEDGKTPETLNIEPQDDQDRIVSSDDFDYTENKLILPWQWNHNPDNSLWSVTDRPGYLRLTTGSVVSNILSARNTLTQRTEGPVFATETKLDTSGLQAGDNAGIAAFCNSYGMLGVKVADDKSKSIIVAFNDGATGNAAEQVSIPLEQKEVYLKIEYIFNAGSGKKLMTIDNAYFKYSLDGVNWQKLDVTLPMVYTLDHFMGYRGALYFYSTKQAGGHADFDYYHIKEFSLK